MKVLLRYHVENLGRRGEVVRVKDGYGRNHLLPKGLAVSVSEENRRRLESQKERFLQEELRRVDEFKAMADKLTALKLVIIEARASSEGHLYGSVGAVQIQAELKEQGFAVDQRSVRIEEPIRRTGTHEVHVHLHPEVDAHILCWVTEEGADADPADAPPVGGWPEEEESKEGAEDEEESDEAEPKASESD